MSSSSSARLRDGGFVALEGAEADQGVDGGGLAVEVAGDADVVEDRERAEEADVLEGAGDAALDDLVDAQAGQRWPSKWTEPGRGLVDAGDEVEDGGLARAVGADEADELAIVDGEIDRVDGGEAAERMVAWLSWRRAGIRAWPCRT
jgi:hypothetical protein